MMIHYDAMSGDIDYTVRGDDPPQGIDGPWLQIAGEDPGDIRLLRVQDGRLVSHPDAVHLARENVSVARAAAFARETDPMIGEVLRGEVSLEAYKAKVSEIRARCPYPVQAADEQSAVAAITKER